MGEYFKNIFKRDDVRHVVENEISPRLVSEAQNKYLMEDVTFDEFTTAITKCTQIKQLRQMG